MKYKFNAWGHQNILGTHKTTLEFTKDGQLSLQGDCILGINSDFDTEKLKEFIKNSKTGKISIIIQASGKKIKEEITAELNPNFCSERDLVIRKTDFISERTFAVKSSKSSFEINRQLINYLQENNKKIIIVIKNRQNNYLTKPYTFKNP